MPIHDQYLVRLVTPRALYDRQGALIGSRYDIDLVADEIEAMKDQ